MTFVAQHKSICAVYTLQHPLKIHLKSTFDLFQVTPVEKRCILVVLKNIILETMVGDSKAKACLR